METKCKIDKSDAPNEWCKYCEESCKARPKFPEITCWDKANAAAMKYAPIDRRKNVNDKRKIIRHDFRNGFFEGYIKAMKDFGITSLQLLRMELLQRGWEDHGDVIVRRSDPRIGWKPADGTLIIGFHEYPEKVVHWLVLEKILKENEDKERNSH